GFARTAAECAEEQQRGCEDLRPKQPEQTSAHRPNLPDRGSSRHLSHDRWAPTGQAPEPVIRVALIDDHPVVRLGLRVAVEASDRLQLVGEGASLADAQRLVSDNSPDLLLLDMRLPDGSAVHALEPLRAARPQLRVVILTGSGTATDAHEALRAGASGYLTKDDLVDTLVESVMAVMAGNVVVSPRVRDDLRELASRPSLTSRERDVLALLVK